jgi:hypothetical protein
VDSLACVAQLHRLFESSERSCQSVYANDQDKVSARKIRLLLARYRDSLDLVSNRGVLEVLKWDVSLLFSPDLAIRLLQSELAELPGSGEG